MAGEREGTLLAWKEQGHDYAMHWRAKQEVGD